MTLRKISKSTIKKTVLNSQKIEGYKQANKSIQEKAKEIMDRYNIKVSA